MVQKPSRTLSATLEGEVRKNGHVDTSLVCVQLCVVRAWNTVYNKGYEELRVATFYRVHLSTHDLMI